MGKRLLFPISLLLVDLLLSCSQPASVRYRAQADSLNQKAYDLRYSSSKRALGLAHQALALATDSTDYPDGRYEALCNIGFLQYMRMNYTSADSSLSEVTSHSRNELLKLRADVTQMRICQRRSANQQFYDYCNSAHKRMERILQEQGSMNGRQYRMFMSVRSDFHLALTTYYYYVRQEDEAQREFKVLADSISLFSSDSTQLALYYFLSGNVRNIDNLLHEDNWQDMVICITISQEKGYHYIQAKAMLSLAADLIQSHSFRPSHMAFLRELLRLDAHIPDSRVGLLLARKALSIFRDYGSLFDVSETCLVLSDYYLYEGDNAQAFAYLEKALECVNRHYLQSNPSDRTRFRALRTYSPEPDSLSEEMRLIHQGRLVCVPEWMADVREHLCLVYSAMGMKAESDYNRNIYLDILDAIRQDRKMEQRLQDLKREEQEVNSSVIVAIVVLSVLVFFLILLGRRMRAKYRVRYAREKAIVEQEMDRWRRRIDERFSLLEDKQEEVEAARYSSERNLNVQKQRYIDRTTCLSIVFSVMPFLDRALNEVRKLHMNHLDKVLLVNRLTYVSELTQRINLYNSILTHWIKVRQGVVALNVENFALNPLLDIVRGGEAAFAAKDIKLTVGQSQAVVKADRALTLFMINTLVENARKFTHPGGQVWVRTQEDEQGVLVSVEDTGRGLSPDDCRKINEEKVYDSRCIGDVEHDSDLKQNKGYGFGLMNCKGIIEKYRKTSSVFSVCRFGVKSELGRGSVFFFRLPKGVLHICLCLILFSILSVREVCAQDVTDYRNGISSERLRKVYESSVSLKALQTENPHLLRAYSFADSTYYANVSRQYERALQFADSACQALNAYYIEQNPEGGLLLTLSGVGVEQMSEIAWWKSGFRTDYYIVLDIRNEAAISALALCRWQTYYYNNEIYTRLYKLMAQDETLAPFCDSIRTANANKQTALAIVVCLFAVALLVSFAFYYRAHILPMFNLRQMLEVSKHIFESESPAQLVQIVYDGVSDIMPIDGVCLILADGTVERSDGCPRLDYLEDVMKFNHASASLGVQTLAEGLVRIYPLTVADTDPSARVGVMAFVLHRAIRRDDEDELLSMLSQYAAVNLYYASVRMDRLKTDIQLADDERKRTEYEMNRVHVQNMVLDNSLSAIKHETMYYPSRIKQVADTLLDNIVQDHADDTSVHFEQNLTTLYELTTYYKSVYALLADCAARQTGGVSFRRTAISLARLLRYASRSFQRQSKRAAKEGVEVRYAAFKTTDDARDWCVKGDESMLQYLFDNAISAFLQYGKCGTWSLDFVESDKFIMFACGFDAVSMTDEEMHTLFYPESIRYDEQTGRLLGAQFLIAKQIVREHDDNVRRGCRIYAEAMSAGGTALVFTLPRT